MTQIQENKLPEGWIEITLGEICEIKGGKRLPKGENLVNYKTNHPYIRITDLENNSINKKQLQFVTDEVFSSISRYIVNSGDVIISIVGSVGFVAKIDDDLDNASLTENCVKLVNLKNLDSVYLYYYLISQLGQNEIQKNTVGAVQKKLPIYGVQNISLSLPSLPEQQAIAKILSSFGDKIELLREQNETLEKIGQEIFKEWFILDKSISKQRLGDLVEVKRGGSPRPIQDYISETGYKWLKISDASATQGPFIFNIKESIIKEGLKKTTLLKEGTLVLSNSATPGIPKILSIDSCIHDGWLHFPKSAFSNEFLYLLFKEIRLELIQQGSGSVFTNLKTDILKNYEAPLPTKELLAKFDYLIKPMFEKIKINSEEIETLSKTRDELLPKLMKGEVRVV